MSESTTVADIDLPTRQLISFLRILADDIENQNVSQEELQRTGEFYMSYKLNSQIDSDDEFSDAEFKKFFTLGWYVYTHVLRDGKPMPLQ